MKKNARVCITTTVRDPGPQFEGFLKYHLKTGFEKIYVFFDNPKDPSIPMTRLIKGVQVIPCDKRLRSKWKKLRAYKQMKNTINSEVMARQTLNANLAMAMAVEEKFDWIFHIDADELIHNRLKWPIGKIMAAVPNEISQVTIHNNEAVPQNMDIDNSFTDITHFKINRRVLSKTKKQKKVFKDFFTKTGRDYFIAYGHGKSAARVRRDIYPAVHNFKKESSSKKLSLYGGPTSCFLDTVHIDQLVIYHYPNCGFDHYLTKYKHLDNFRPPSYNAYPKGSVHLVSRDAYMAKDFVTLKSIYKKRIQISGEKNIEKLIKAKILERNDFMSNLIIKLTTNK
jgi:hypothetical protein